jgi:hypothetical protein
MDVKEILWKGEVLTAVTMESINFWNLLPFGTAEVHPVFRRNVAFPSNENKNKLSNQAAKL